MGTICAQCSEGTGIAVTTINKNLIQKTRSSMPLLSQKRFDLYPKMAEPALNENADQYQFGQVMVSSRAVFYRTNLTLAIVNKRCVVPGRILQYLINDISNFLKQVISLTRQTY